MRHDKLERELYLLRLLSENSTYTVSDLCERVGISRRNLYYYLEFFKDSGFHVYKRQGCYCISRDSPFFAHIIDRISFTEDEALLLRHLTDNARQDNILIAGVRKKLDRFYDFNIIRADDADQRTVDNIRTLYDAIKLRRQVLLHGYASPHSRSTRDRLVEPFKLMNNNNEVRCYEPSSSMNKTFKPARMQSVEMLDTPWQHRDRHREMFTDVFMFSGEETKNVSITLGQLSHRLLVEEYPLTARYTTALPDGRHRFAAPLCSYTAIGRFILGLFDDITVESDDGLHQYLREKIEDMYDKTTKQPVSND